KKLKIMNDYKIGDVVFSITNGQLVKTKIIKLYDSHVGIYCGELTPYRKQYTDIARTKEQLLKKLKVDDLCRFADLWIN
ncbi:MAG: hypothetical protein PF487_07650, partial [Bacteroidales bacterium]|nr:hypothetical protein [Bacteroidales bacterium]